MLLILTVVMNIPNKGSQSDDTDVKYVIVP